MSRRRYVFTWRAQGHCCRCGQWVGHFAAAFGNGAVWCDGCAYGQEAR